MRTSGRQHDGPSHVPLLEPEQHPEAVHGEGELAELMRTHSIAAAFFTIERPLQHQSRVSSHHVDVEGEVLAREAIERRWRGAKGELCAHLSAVVTNIGLQEVA